MKYNNSILYIIEKINIDIFAKLKDYDELEIKNKIITYDQYFKIRHITINRDINKKLIMKINNNKIKLNDILKCKYFTLFIYIINKYMDDFPINILIDKNWPKEYINLAYKSKTFYYLYFNGKKTIKINSLKSAINKYNYPAILELLKIGIKPMTIDYKIAEYVNIKQITEALNYFS